MIAPHEKMPQFSETIEIGRPPEEVWTVLGQPERWVEGYVESTSRSRGYPNPLSHDYHVYKTRMKEEVQARVTRSEPPSSFEEEQKGKTFSRQLRYRLEPTDAGTRVIVEDDIKFLGPAKLAAPIASRDVRKRWPRSLQRLKEAAESGG